MKADVVKKNLLVLAAGLFSAFALFYYGMYFLAAATVAAVASRQPENELMKVSADPAPNVQMVEVTDDDEAYLSMLDEI